MKSKKEEKHVLTKVRLAKASPNCKVLVARRNKISEDSTKVLLTTRLLVVYDISSYRTLSNYVLNHPPKRQSFETGNALNRAQT